MIKSESKVIVVGMGDCGVNIIDKMIERGIREVAYVAMNKEQTSLDNSRAGNTILIEGNGCVQELTDSIAPSTKMVVLTGSLGGNTATKYIPLVTSALDKKGFQNSVVVTMPFAFEGEKRQQITKKCLNLLRENNTLLEVIYNEPLMEPGLAVIEFFDRLDDENIKKVMGFVDKFKLNKKKDI
jgi:cell division protein FtsZ